MQEGRGESGQLPGFTSALGKLTTIVRSGGFQLPALTNLLEPGKSDQTSDSCPSD
jgi:hypothetical protein